LWSLKPHTVGELSNASREATERQSGMVYECIRNWITEKRTGSRREDRVLLKSDFGNQ